jgi:hypothetical protein
MNIPGRPLLYDVLSESHRTTGRVADLAIALGGLPVWLQAAGLMALAIATVLGLNKAWRSSQTKLATNTPGLEPPVRSKGGLSR